MLYWIGLGIVVACIMLLGGTVIGTYLLIRALLDKISKRSYNAADTVPVPVPVPEYREPGSMAPGVIPLSDRPEDTSERARVGKMVLALRSRTLVLLRRQGVDESTARLLASAYATDMRLNDIPFTIEDQYSEYADEFMPATGPLQTAVHEMSMAVKAGIGADHIALALQKTTCPIYCGWGYSALIKNK